MSTIDNKVYEDFKELYLSPKGYTQEQCYEMLLAKGYKEDEIPTLPTFSHRLRQEYPKDAIKKLRTHKKKAANSKDVEFFNIYKKRKKPNEINFEIAAQDYWNAIINNEIETCKNQKYFIQKLIKYFNGIKLGEIVKDKIFEFRDSLIAEGFSLNIVKTLLSLFFTMLRVSGIIVNFFIYQEIRHSCKLYSLEEIKEIILQDSPKAWIIILGLRLSELQALKYEDINFETQIITIRRRNEYGKIREFKSKKFIREIKCPQLLLDRLKHTNCGYIFEKINFPEYESCLYAHIMLLQAQNVPLNIITKEMGYESINSFYCTFYYLFPNKLENDFNILKPLNL